MCEAQEEVSRQKLIAYFILEISRIHSKKIVVEYTLRRSNMLAFMYHRFRFFSFQIFAFSVTNNNWHLYDWTKVTTIAHFHLIDPQLVCYAHSKGVRVVYGGRLGLLA